MATAKRNIVIIGGGIIGCCTAYYLTRHPRYDPARHKITLLESSDLAQGSSGKAGGLVAKCAFPQELSGFSFELHKQLAQEHKGQSRWGYRPVTCGEVSATGRNVHGGSKTGKSQGSTRDTSGMPSDLDWLDPGTIQDYDVVGADKVTAQVHPYQFTTSIARLAQDTGVDIRLNAQATSIEQDSQRVTGVAYLDHNTNGSSTSIAATDVILCAGPWTKTLYDHAPITTYRVHSITIRPTRELSPYTIFTSIKLPSEFRSRTDESHNQSSTSTHKPGVRAGTGLKSASTVTPEIYSRPGNEVYVSGESDQLVPLPDRAVDIGVDESRCEDIFDYVGIISDEPRDGELLVRQACYLPLVETRAGEGPILGPAAGRGGGGGGVEGLVIAAGHTCWGISNGPATGKVVSEMLFDGQVSCADVDRFSPEKLCRR